MIRLALAALLGTIFSWGAPATALAEQGGPEARLTAELETLASGEGADIVASEIDQARELLRLAEQARLSGQDPTAQTLLSLVPLQLQLVREILAAVRAEAEADTVEERLQELLQERRVARDALERVLERLVAASAGGGR